MAEYQAAVILGNAFGDRNQRIGTGWAGTIKAARAEDVPALARAMHTKSDCNAYPEWIIGVEVYDDDGALILAAQ